MAYVNIYSSLKHKYKYQVLYVCCCCCCYYVCLVSVRLAGESRVPNAGRLEVNYDCSWGTVCDDGFDNNDAQVACVMLGFG